MWVHDQRFTLTGHAVTLAILCCESCIQEDAVKEVEGCEDCSGLAADALSYMREIADSNGVSVDDHESEWVFRMIARDKEGDAMVVGSSVDVEITTTVH